MNQRKAPPCETSVTPRRATALAALWLLSTCYGCGGDRFEAGAHGESGGQGGAGGSAVASASDGAPGGEAVMLDAAATHPDTVLDGAAAQGAPARHVRPTDIRDSHAGGGAKQEPNAD